MATTATTSTNMVTLQNVEMMKHQVARMYGFKAIYRLDTIELCMCHFDYESESVEMIVFNFCRSILHENMNEAKIFLNN